MNSKEDNGESDDTERRSGIFGSEGVRIVAAGLLLFYPSIFVVEWTITSLHPLVLLTVDLAFVSFTYTILAEFGIRPF
jgi:hypothetical protein